MPKVSAELYKWYIIKGEDSPKYEDGSLKIVQGYEG